MHSALDAEEIAGVAVGVATALADMHKAGRAHGSVDARHVVVEGGAVGLRAVEPPPASATPADDVRALGALVGQLLDAALPSPREAPRRSVPLRARVRPLIARLRRGRPGLLVLPPVEQVLATIAHTASGEHGDSPPTAASIAALIALKVPSARPPGRRPPSPDASSLGAAAGSPVPDLRTRLVRGRAGGLATTGRLLAVFPWLALVASGWWLAAALRHRTDRPHDHPPDPPPAYDNGVLATPTGRYQLGQPGDVVATDDWLCRGSPVPALLHPATGEVFVFDHWPVPGGSTPGRKIGVVPGAAALQAVPTDDGCPLLAAVPAGGTPVTLPVAAP